MILRCHILITYCQVAESICYYLANSYVILSSSYHDIEMRDEEEEEDADYEEEDEEDDSSDEEEEEEEDE